MNDLDFIKAKFEESGVSVPEDLTKEKISEKLNNIEPKKKSRKKFYFSAAACIAVLLIAAISANIIAGGFLNTSIKTLKTDTGEIKSFKSFKSRSEVINTLSKIKSDNLNENFSAGATAKSNSESDIGLSTSSGNSSHSTPHSETYKQVEGVDEGDIVKTDGKYIYVVEKDYEDEGIVKIAVYNPKPETKFNESKKSPEPKLETEIKINSESKKLQVDWLNDIYIHGKYLIANVDLYRERSDDFESYTASYIYDVSDIKNIKRVTRFTQSGSYVSSRIVGDKLYLISNEEVSKNNIPKTFDGESTPDEIPFKDICCPEKPSVKSFLVISSINIGGVKEKTVTKAVLGAADTVYCNGNNLYAVAETYNNPGVFYGVVEDGYVPTPKPVKSQIIKFNLENGIKAVGSVKLKGSVKDNYSLDEKDGYLRVSSTYEGKSYTENKIFIIDSDMKLVGETEAFGKDEWIKAVKYVGNTAYAITYRETDPLFVIDLSDVTAPKILGSVKIKGFSSMLVPVNDTRLLGIGFSDKGYLKLVIFDVSNPTEPEVLDSHVVKYAYSDVQEEPKALVYNPERDCYTVPVYDMAYGGAYTFSLKSDKINELDYYTPQNMENCDRCVFIGDKIYLADCEKLMVAVRAYK